MTNSVISLEQTSKQAKANAAQQAVSRPAHELARELWKRLVGRVGEAEAKEIMRHVMGAKRVGRPKTDENRALMCFIYSYIRRQRNQTDKTIAKHIFESKPYYIECESGAIAVVNNEVTETFMSSADDPIVQRRPLNKSLTAIQKQTERIRRWTIAEDLLPKDFAPRNYCRE